MRTLLRLAGWATAAPYEWQTGTIVNLFATFALWLRSLASRARPS
jgi:hypothetical protein